MKLPPAPGRMRVGLVIDAAVSGPMRHAPGRMALAVVAIALGVALGLSIYLINRSAADEISIAARSLYGVADFSIEGAAAGFDESLYPRVARIVGVAAVSPVVEVEAKLVDARGAIRLIGVDAFRSRQLQPALAAPSQSLVSALEADVVFVAAEVARELDLGRGDELRVQRGLERVTLEVGDVLPPAALKQRAGLIDIALAQHRFDRLGKLSRIDVRLASGVDPDAVRAAIERTLPPGVSLVTPGEAGDDAVRLSRAYRSNLTALGLVALFTGGFFVYSTLSLLVLKRRREFAILHALGFTRAQQLVAVLAASALIGVAGASMGLVLGVGVARFGLGTLGADLGAGLFRGVAPALALRPGELLAFALLGVAVALAGGVRPALDAARIATASALKAGDVVSADVRSHTALVLLLLALAAGALFAPPIAGLPFPGYLAIALLLIAVVAGTPALMRAVLRAAPPTRSAAVQVALAQISGAARYATLSVAAIIVSFSLMTSMAIMVTSFRESLDAWTQKLLPADVYLRSGYVGQSAFLAPDVVDALAELPEVARIERSRFAQIQVRSAAPSAPWRALTLIARAVGESPGEALWITAAAPSQPPAGATRIWINEAAADLYAWRPGDVREILLAGRQVRTFVAGVWRDYEHMAGAVVMERDVYVRLTGDRAVNTVWIWRQDGARLEDVQRAVRAVLPDDAAFEMRTPGELRGLSLAVFDRTFAVTYVLELVAILIGLFGIAAGASAQVLARRGELGALRHLGFTRGQVGAMLATEGAVLGAVGVAIGLFAGALVSVILVYVVNRQSFHWSMDLFPPYALLAGLSVALIASSALIAVVAGRHALSADVVSAVKEDW